MTETAHTPLPCPWKVGDKVQRKPGASYLFPGVIISVGLKLDGKTWHCEVECIAPGVEGCTHVFPASQLVPLDPAWNTRTPSHHDLVEALRWYADQMCEGLCMGKDPKACASIGSDNCAGCPAVVALGGL